MCIRDRYYIQMAVAWAISICFIKFYDETKEFMKKSNIEKFTYNKAIQKAIESYRITEEQKEELRKLKKNIRRQYAAGARSRRGQNL